MENAWHSRNLIFLIIGALFSIVGMIFLFAYYQFIGLQIIGIVLLVLGIIFLIKGLKQYGYLMINGEDWKFHFNRREDIASIENFIKEVYFIKGD